MEIKDIAEAITAQKTAWGEFTKTNDEILAAKADGKSVADLAQKLDLINTDLTKSANAFAEFEKKAGRPSAENQMTEDQAEHKKSFSRFLRKGATDGLQDLQMKAIIAVQIQTVVILYCQKWTCRLTVSLALFPQCIVWLTLKTLALINIPSLLKRLVWRCVELMTVALAAKLPNQNTTKLLLMCSLLKSSHGYSMRRLRILL